MSEVDRRMQLVRDIAGDRYARLELNTLVQRVVVTDYRRQAAEELASRWTQLSPDEILESPYVLIGTVDQMIEDLQVRGSAGAFRITLSSSPTWTPSPPSSPGLPATRHWSGILQP